LAGLIWSGRKASQAGTAGSFLWLWLAAAS
jgi:hypothetical protein